MSHTLMRSLSHVVIPVMLALAAAPRASAAQQTDVIRGRVTGPDSLPVQGVNVKATSYAGSVTKTATTDKSGRFTIVFINGEGDYWLDFIKLGFAPRRFEIKKVGDEEVMLADARLSSTIAALDAVNVVGQRNRALPNRNAAGVDVSGGDRPLTNTGLPPDQAGNLAAMAAAVAGFQLIPGLDGAPDMYSLLGLGGDQNNTTFNGLGSSISGLPPDILASTSIHPYPFDPSLGGFSGAQIVIQTLPGSNFSRRAMSNVNVAPPLEWPDETAAAQGQTYTSLRFGGNAAGPIATDRAFYNSAYNVSRRFSDVHTLLNTDAAGLAAAGVAPDSIRRLLSILQNNHVPTTADRAPRLETQDLAQGSVNFDFMPSASGTGHSFTLGALGNYRRTQPVSRGGLLLTTPAHAGETSLWSANTALVHSNYFWFGILTKTTLGFAATRSTTAPYERLPEGSVRVSSMLPDGSASVKSLSFGGGSALSSSSNRAIQLNNQLSWYSADNRHTVKTTTSLARDDFAADVTQSLLGTFAFNSLADLEAGTPASFTRTLSRNRQTGSQLIATGSIGDYWRPSPGVQVQYGVRVDANRFLVAPALNPAVSDAFGVRNDVVPNRAYLSPRLGVQWYYGSSPLIAYAPGAARPPRAVVHAGIGVFQNTAPSQLVAPAVSATGLPTSTQSITCVGEAVPFPDWSRLLTDESAIPTRCADGTTGSVFASSAPNVTLFDARFRQPRSLRTAADWSSPVIDNRLVLGVQGIASVGLSQSGVIDINFNPATRFSLGVEGRRPVFADPAAIVPATGAIASRASRVVPAFQHVWLERSDLRIDSRQLTVNLKPVTANPRLRWDLTYTLLDAREKFYGFSSTVGNPLDTEWGPSLQSARHSVMLTWADFPIFDLVYITAGLRLNSGLRYTPSISGDVNGDGSSNDRAYVFDPSTLLRTGPSASGDSATAAAMRSLLATGTRSARECLTRQLGTLAGRGSCASPWTATAGLVVKFNPQKIGLPKRATVSLQVQNPLGLADLALHGSSNIRGWGQAISPDQNLLFVRGFDAASRQYTYEVNQRFGSTRPQQTVARALPYISLAIGLDVGIPRERQLLTQRLNVGRGRPGTKQPAASMKSFGTSAIPNPMSMILQQADSLGLTRVQADSLATLSYTFSVYADSIWTPVASELAALPNEYNAKGAYDRYVSARERTVDYLLTLAADVKGVLTPAQRRRLPLQLSNYLDERVLKFLRSSTAGDNSPVIIR